MWPSWCHCHSLSLASVKSRLVLPFWYRLTWVVPEKGPLNGCVCVCNIVAFWSLILHWFQSLLIQQTCIGVLAHTPVKDFQIPAHRFCRFQRHVCGVSDLMLVHSLQVKWHNWHDRDVLFGPSDQWRIYFYAIIKVIISNICNQLALCRATQSFKESELSFLVAFKWRILTKYLV